MKHCECGGDLWFYDGSLGYEAWICVKCREHWADQTTEEHEAHVERYRSGVRNANQALDGGWIVELRGEKSAVLRFADERYASHICRIDENWICDEHNVNIPKLAYLLAAAPRLLSVCRKAAAGDLEGIRELAQDAVNKTDARKCSCGRWHTFNTVNCLYSNKQTPWASELKEQYA